MEDQKTANDILQSMLSQILSSKNPALKKAGPGFLLRYLKKNRSPDEPRIPQEGRSSEDAEFIAAGLEEFEIS
jgi:hypothetical protein